MTTGHCVECLEIGRNKRVQCPVLVVDVCSSNQDRRNWCADEKGRFEEYYAIADVKTYLWMGMVDELKSRT